MFGRPACSNPLNLCVGSDFYYTLNVSSTSFSASSWTDTSLLTSVFESNDVSRDRRIAAYSNHVSLRDSYYLSSGLVNISDMKVERISVVEMYLNARATKGIGPKKIEMEMYSKKDDSMHNGNAKEAYESWTENAANELKKKFKGIKPTDYQSKMKQKQFLFNRGFSTQIIERIL